MIQTRFSYIHFRKVLWSLQFTVWHIYDNKQQATKAKKDLKMHITIIRDIDFSCFHEMKQK